MSREDYIRGAAHQEFRRDDYLNRLAAHAGIEHGDQATRDQFSAFGHGRRAALGEHYDRHPIRARAMGAVNRVRERHERHQIERGRNRGEEQQR